MAAQLHHQQQLGPGIIFSVKLGGKESLSCAHWRKCRTIFTHYLLLSTPPNVHLCACLAMCGHSPRIRCVLLVVCCGLA